MATDEDGQLFAKAVAGVVPIKSKKAAQAGDRCRTASVPEFTLHRRRQQAMHESQSQQEALPEHVAFPAAPEEHLQYARPSLHSRCLRDLSKGRIAIEYNLDLHGLTLTQARVVLDRFICFCRQHRHRCVRVIHGKSYHAFQTGRPTMKGAVNSWLRQFPDVLAFVSCRLADGGTGAVYVLLQSSCEEELQ